MLCPNLVKTNHLSIVVVLLAGLLTGCHRDEQIQTYSAPKEQPGPPPTLAAPAPSMSDPGAPPVPVNAAPIHWTTPAAWKEVAPTSIRIGNFLVPGADGKKAEVSITSFPGDVGGTLANVTRWRNENGLGPIQEADITSQPASVDSTDGKLYDIAGTSARTVVAVIPRDGASWFFKLRGDPATVAAAEPTFREFLRSIHFGGSATAQPSVAPTTMPEPVATSSPGAAPNWTPPANWAETPPGPMVLKSYSVSGDAGQKAAVSISILAGSGGALLANVNRWRGQISLPPMTDADLPAVTRSVDVMGGQATVVDFTGTDKSGQPSRLVAAMVPHGEQTWFYKLMGEGSVVEKEKPGFVKFVQTVQY
jgi:hypothetical protein